jgi:delta-aminolevulinic acid dehydratase/porphobilinogen synthase
MPGVERVSEDEYAEQVERMKSGLIPNLNDLGAVQAAKDTIAMYGSDD